MQTFPLNQPTPGSARDDSLRPSNMALLIGQLLLFALIAFRFQIESQRSFPQLLCLAIAGFVIQALLPSRWHVPWFAVLCMAGLFLILETASATAVLGIGLGLIAICHLPLATGLRSGLLIAAGGLLVYQRANLDLPFWPILGSMFMFRLLIFLLETRNKPHPAWSTSISYFFLLPNVCFPLFPVVDLKTFCTSRKEGNQLAIYERGMTWLVWGGIHLLLQRWISMSIVPSSQDIVSASGLAIFMASNYALYLQVSGQFHIVTGLLHLFGFNLPRTHDHYFLASSVTDIWRRINIYWKDFLAKFCFFPVFHQVRQRGGSVQLSTVLGVAAVFVATWILHAWQTFWLLGTFSLTWNDGWLWFAAGVCVAGTSIYELRRQSIVNSKSLPAAWRRAWRILGTFWLVSLFWACWTQPGFLLLARQVLWQTGTVGDSVMIMGWMIAIQVMLTLGIWTVRNGWFNHSPGVSPTRRFEHQTSLLRLAGLGLVVALTSSGMAKQWGTSFAESLSLLQSDIAQRRAEESRLRGYYEALNTASIPGGAWLQSASGIAKAPQEVAAVAQGFDRISRPADIYQEVELIPDISVDVEGVIISINQFGMRDRTSISRNKPPGTFRIAILGSSIVMGYGVADDEVFPRVLESRLRSLVPAAPMRIEVLNFGVGKQWAPQRFVRLQRQVLLFQPDMLIYVAHQDEFTDAARHPARLVYQGRPLPSPVLTVAVTAAGVTPGMAWGAIEAHLELHRLDILKAHYACMTAELAKQKIVPIFAYVPIPGTTEANPGPQLLQLAEQAGFQVCDLTHWFADATPDEIFREHDRMHPNARGHELIAEALAKWVQSHHDLLPFTQSVQP